MLRLIKLKSSDGEEIYKMLQTIESNENEFKNPVNGMSYEDYKQWLLVQEQWSKGENLPTGYVPQTIFWLYDGKKPVGVGKIRHHLTEASRNVGGNIGYGISASERCKGYGKTLVTLLKEKCNEMGIDERLLTVEKYNPTSKAVIEKCGGKLIKENTERWFFTI